MPDSSRQRSLFTTMFLMPELTSTVYVEPDLTPLSVVVARADVDPLAYHCDFASMLVDLFA